MNLAPYHSGLETLDQELTNVSLPLQGTLPQWLNGMLLRTGPAKFEVNGEPYRHWFDGLAMLYQFQIADNQIHYSNRFLHSGSYEDAQEVQQISRPEFGTYPDKSALTRLLTAFAGLPSTDNANVNISAISLRHSSAYRHQPVALTETPSPIAFNPDTLDTLSHFTYSDDFPGQVTTAHPHFDFHRQQLLSYQIEFGRQSAYLLYTLDADSSERKLLAKIPVDKPAYMHSFPVSEHYAILVECPLRVNPLRLATNPLHQTPFIANYHWQPQQKTRFHIIDRKTGQLVNTCESEPFFAFHYVNAFEDNGNLIVDASSYPDAEVIQGFYLDKLRYGTDTFENSKLTRYTLPLQGDTVTSSVISDAVTEFPRINYQRCNGKPYRFVYGGDSQHPANFIDQLVKINVETGESQTWQQDNCYPGEPVFVATPDSETEDDGVILSLVLDANRQQTFLLILNAQTFTEIARADVPHIIPFGFHGQFFPATAQSLANPHFHR